MRITKKKAYKVGTKLGMDFEDYSISEFRRGLEVELEHKDVTGGDLIKTGMIAGVHLNEYSDYYTRLRKVEK